MDKITNLIELLGIENQNKIKDSVTNFIIDAIEDDINDYKENNYILCPEEIVDFVDECKQEAFNKMRPILVERMMKKLDV